MSYRCEGCKELFKDHAKPIRTVVKWRANRQIEREQDLCPECATTKAAPIPEKAASTKAEAPDDGNHRLTDLEFADVEDRDWSRP